MMKTEMLIYKLYDTYSRSEHRVVSRKSYFDNHLGKLQSKYNFDNDSNIVVMSKYVEMSKCCRNV